MRIHELTQHRDFSDCANVMGWGEKKTNLLDVDHILGIVCSRIDDFCASGNLE
jgi:hypothetical protein